MRADPPTRRTGPRGAPPARPRPVRAPPRPAPPRPPPARPRPRPQPQPRDEDDERAAPSTGTIKLASAVSSSGQETLTVSNPNGSTEHLYAQVLAPLTAGGVIARAKAPKSILVASARVKVPAHRKHTLTLRLSKAAVTQLRRKHTLKVTLRLTLSARGHKDRVVTRSETLHLRT